MPQNAIATEMVDFVLPPGEMREFCCAPKPPCVAGDSAAPRRPRWTAEFLQDVLTLVDRARPRLSQL